MEIDLNKDESTETSIFINFSIREYVAEIRKNYPAKCWPFGSMRDPDNKQVVSSYQSTFLCGQNCPSIINGSDDTTELTESPNYMIESLGVDINMGKSVNSGSSELTFCEVNNGQTRHEINNDEGVKIRHNVAADNNEPGRNRPRRKPKKFRLLSDIYEDPASGLRASSDRTNPKNVNSGFVAEIEDESDDDDDDVTLAAYFRKQKGIEISDLTLNKKRDLITLEEPSVDQDEKSNYGSVESIRMDSNVGTSRKKIRTDDVDTQTMPEHKKDFRLQCSQKSNQILEATEKENEDSEMEAVMLLARHFNEQNQNQRALERHTTCACVKKKIREHTTQSVNKPVTKTSSKTKTKRRVRKITNKTAFRSLQSISFIQSHIETSMMKAAGVRPDAQTCATHVCSFNRNPADFSAPNGENEFMRGG